MTTKDNEEKEEDDEDDDDDDDDDDDNNEDYQETDGIEIKALGIRRRYLEVEILEKLNEKLKDDD